MWNRERRRQGQLDSALTADGTRQAEAAASVCLRLGVDRIFTSPLGRARETALILSSTLTLPVEEVDDLAEVHHGAFAGLTNDEIALRYPGALDVREREKYTWAFPGGESYADAAVRASRAIDRVAATGAASPLLVTHEMIGRMLMRSLLELSVEEALVLPIPHGTVLEVNPVQRRATSHDASPPT